MKELRRTEYNEKETEFLVKGFSNGFDLGYRGPWNQKDQSDNIPLNSEVGTHQDIWQKVMKEVGLARFSGPYLKIPFEFFVQSPIGLVPKAGNQSRLIFHLSYDFKGGGMSINHHIRQEFCSVKYRDMDHAVQTCLDILKNNPGAALWFGVSDLKSAFHLIPLSKQFWLLLLLKAKDPNTGEWQYFVDKCLPFGASISCAIFQRFSNALVHILKYRVRHILYKGVTNYLDDFLNIALTEDSSNAMIKTFHKLCEWLGVPLAKEKTVWVTVRLVFLGIL